jgi:hypothetical protein
MWGQYTKRTLLRAKGAVEAVGAASFRVTGRLSVPRSGGQLREPAFPRQMKAAYYNRAFRQRRHRWPKGQSLRDGSGLRPIEPMGKLDGAMPGAESAEEKGSVPFFSEQKKGTDPQETAS